MGQARRELEQLKDTTLLRSIREKTGILERNPLYGNKVPRALWPKKLAAEYALTNLWRVGLAGYWRMLYTLGTTNSEMICLVIHLSDHERYDRLFGYGKR